MISSELQKAIDTLQIQDVYLRSSQTTCDDDFDPKYVQDIETLGIQQMQFIKQTQIAEIESGGFLARIFVLMGNRWTQPAAENIDPKIEMTIEAEFIAEYFMSSELDQACLNEFAQKNVIVHVWPYWREFLSSQCDRLRFARLVVPNFQLAHHRFEQEK